MNVIWNNYSVFRFGENPYRLGILICTHWDETLWYSVMENVKHSIKDVSFVLMNRKAFDLQQRYIDFDLNRCFLLNDSWFGWGSYEYYLSLKLDHELKKFETIIDVHSTNFDIEPYFIIDKVWKTQLEIIRCTNNNLVRYVYLIPLSKGTVIWNYPNAVSIECGANDNKNRIKELGYILENISNNLNSQNVYEKEIYTFSWELNKDEVYEISEEIKDFELIPKWYLLWTNKIGDWVCSKEQMRLFWVKNNFSNTDIVAIKLQDIS